MKFPITRESLQAFDSVKEQEEREEEEIQKRFALILEGLCKEFQRSMPSNTREKRFVWRNIGQIKDIKAGLQYVTIGDIQKAAQNMECLPRFVEKLKETFVGCDIIIDPLKTYMVIDWS